MKHFMTGVSYNRNICAFDKFRTITQKDVVINENTNECKWMKKVAHSFIKKTKFAGLRLKCIIK